MSVLIRQSTPKTEAEFRRRRLAVRWPPQHAAGDSGVAGPSAAVGGRGYSGPLSDMHNTKGVK